MNREKDLFGELIQVANQSWLSKLFAREGNEVYHALGIRLEPYRPGKPTELRRVALADFTFGLVELINNS